MLNLKIETIFDTKYCQRTFLEKLSGKPSIMKVPFFQHPARFGLWLFEWAFLGACAALPFITWYAANHAVDVAIRERSPRVRDQREGT